MCEILKKSEKICMRGEWMAHIDSGESNKRVFNFALRRQR